MNLTRRSKFQSDLEKCNDKLADISSKYLANGKFSAKNEDVNGFLTDLKNWVGAFSQRINDEVQKCSSKSKSKQYLKEIYEGCSVFSRNFVLLRAPLDGNKLKDFSDGIQAIIEPIEAILKEIPKDKNFSPSERLASKRVMEKLNAIHDNLGAVDGNFTSKYKQATKK